MYGGAPAVAAAFSGSAASSVPIRGSPAQAFKVDTMNSAAMFLWIFFGIHYLPIIGVILADAGGAAVVALGR